MTTPRRVFGLYPDFDINSVNNWDVWASRLLWPCKYLVNARERQRWYLYGCLSWSDKRQFTCVCRSKGSGKTESGHIIVMFFSSAAKIVTFVINLNLQFVFWRSWVHFSTISNFSTFPGFKSNPLSYTVNTVFRTKYGFRVLYNTDILPFRHYGEQIQEQFWFLRRNPACWRLLQASPW